MPIYSQQCQSCDWKDDILVKVGENPPCPKCGANTEHYWSSAKSRYFQDDIPGGLVLENLGHTPVTVYSHSERLTLMRKRGLQECVYAVEGDKHTKTWNTAPAYLTQADEDARKRHWHETEAEFAATKPTN